MNPLDKGGDGGNDFFDRPKEDIVDDPSLQPSPDPLDQVELRTIYSALKN